MRLTLLSTRDCCLHVNHLQCVRNLRGLLILQVCTTSHCVLIACLLGGNAFIIASCLFVQIVFRLFCSSLECWILEIIICNISLHSGQLKHSRLFCWNPVGCQDWRSSMETDVWTRAHCWGPDWNSDSVYRKSICCRRCTPQTRLHHLLKELFLMHTQSHMLAGGLVLRWRFHRCLTEHMLALGKKNRHLFMDNCAWNIIPWQILVINYILCCLRDFFDLLLGWHILCSV